jgi:hypothetical protein
MPRWLDWIPRVTIEGDPDEPVEVGAEAVVPVEVPPREPWLTARTN